jgi:hypothetical protein
MDHNKIETAEIEAIIASVDNMPELLKVMIYCQARAWRQSISELSKIADLFNEQYYRVVEITKIKKDMYVVEYEDRQLKKKYFKPIRKTYLLSERFCDFDSALLAALAFEKTGETEAGYWAGRLLGIGGCQDE